MKKTLLILILIGTMFPIQAIESTIPRDECYYIHKEAQTPINNSHGYYEFCYSVLSSGNSTTLIEGASELISTSTLNDGYFATDPTDSYYDSRIYLVISDRVAYSYLSYSDIYDENGSVIDTIETINSGKISDYKSDMLYSYDGVNYSISTPHRNPDTCNPYGPGRVYYGDECRVNLPYDAISTLSTLGNYQIRIATSDQFNFKIRYNFTLPIDSYDLHYSLEYYFIVQHYLGFVRVDISAVNESAINLLELIMVYVAYVMYKRKF